MKMIKIYWSAVVSVLISFGYFLSCLPKLVSGFETFFGLALYWAAVAWIAVLIHLVLMCVKIIKKQEGWRHNAGSALTTFLIYVALIYGFSNGHIPSA